MLQCIIYSRDENVYSGYLPILLLLQRHRNSTTWNILHKLPLHRLEDCSPNNKHPLLFAPHPLHYLHRPLRQRLPTRIRRRNSIQFKQRRTPRQRNTTTARLVMDLQARRLRVQRRMQVRVQAR